VASSRRSLALAALLLVAACAPAKQATDAGASPTPTPIPTNLQNGSGALAARACPTGNITSWDDFGAPFFRDWCTGCHSSTLPAGQRQNAPMGVDFDTLAGIRATAGTIYDRAGDSNIEMPPVAGPDATTRQFLGDWLACGTP
jgi:uncharacterized membrane protein